MAKPPKKPQKTKRDPAKPTRAKASRPDAPPTRDALADLLDPAVLSEEDKKLLARIQGH